MNKEFIKWYNARGKRNSQITMEFMEEAFNAGMQTSNQRYTQDISNQAKAAAEVLRCAEILYEDHSMAAFGECECEFCKAVRAAREVNSKEFGLEE